MRVSWMMDLDASKAWLHLFSPDPTSGYIYTLFLSLLHDCTLLPSTGTSLLREGQVPGHVRGPQLRIDNTTVCCLVGHCQGPCFMELLAGTQFESCPGQDILLRFLWFLYYINAGMSTKMPRHQHHVHLNSTFTFSLTFIFYCLEQIIHCH
jgi:hypothetical protein